MTEGRDHSRARFRQLVGRALFELRMASDVARAEGYGPAVTNPLEGARRNLNECLKRAGAPRGRDEATTGGLEK